ncbi:hypothetical protein BASA81_007842 [Batrachochytrium salamandrivorans]|nr:hypothetical protein BASA81_007842 [Batrachochytrium salamandrivorans]
MQDDDPLMVDWGAHHHPLCGSPIKPVPAPVASYAPPTFASLIAAHSQSDYLPSKSHLRARLSALEQDLGGSQQDEDRISARLQNPKSRKWVLEQLQRDCWVYWERQDRAMGLRCVCLMAGALSGPTNNLLWEWEFVTNALGRFGNELNRYLASVGAGEAWYVKISHVRGLLPRLYMQIATWQLVPIPERNFVQQSRGVSSPIKRMFLLAFWSKMNPIAFATTRDLCELFEFTGQQFDLLLPLALILVSVGSDGGEEEFCQRMMAKCGPSCVAVQAVMLVSSPKAILHSTRLVLEVINKCVIEFPIYGGRLLACLADRLLLCPTLDLAKWQQGKECIQALYKLIGQVPCSMEALAKFVILCARKRPVDETRLFLRELCQLVLTSQQLDSKDEEFVYQALQAIAESGNVDMLQSDDYFQTFDSLRINKRMVARTILQDVFEDQLSLLPLALECCKHCEQELASFLQKCITRIVLGNDQRFTLLVDLRKAFSRSQRALKTLVMAMCWLITEANARGTVSSPSSLNDLLCAGVGFCHATIPSLVDITERGICFCHVAMVSASVGRLKQCDALFKAAIQCLASGSNNNRDGGDEDRERNELRRLELCRTLASTLVVAPGHPHAFYLVAGFANAVQAWEWKQTNGEALLVVLCLMEAITRPILPYHIAQVDSNDVLYGDHELSVESIKLASVIRAKITADYVALLPACSAKLRQIQTNLELRKAQVYASTN